MLRVLFNATALQVPLAGVGQYTLRLAQALQALGSITLDCFDGRRVSRELHVAPSAQRARIHAFARAAVPGAYAARRWLLQRRFDAGRAGHDLYHEPATVALAYDGPTVLTVHDLSWIRHPEAHPPARVRELERHFEPGLRRAARVITGSAFVKDEIAATFGFPADRIDVIAHGCEPLFHPRGADETRSVLERHGLVHGSYFLCVGTLEPRKNLRLALDAHASLPASLRESHPLVVAGMAGWGPEAALGSARVLGYVEREELAGLVAGATALVYPSRYEGFGLPALEAMACGVPAITSNQSSLPEVVGDAGILVDPDDVGAMARAMNALASDAGLRAAFNTRALERARGFTWEASARATVQSYRLATGGRA